MNSKVYLGLTREPTIAAIPVNAFIMIVFATFWLVMVFKSPILLAVGILLYGICYLAIQSDEAAIDIWYIKAFRLKQMFLNNRLYWQAKSYSAECEE